VVRLTPELPSGDLRTYTFAAVAGWPVRTTGIGELDPPAAVIGHPPPPSLPTKSALRGMGN